MSLHDAVRNGNAAEVRTLIATGSNVNQVDKLKRTPLHIAAWTGNKEILQILVRANANVTDKASDAFTPLHFVVQSQSAEAADCVRVLLKANKSLSNMRISKGNKSALHLAAAKGNENVIFALIELGADLNATTSSGQTYLDLIKSEELKSKLVKKVEELKSAPKKVKHSDDHHESGEASKAGDTGVTGESSNVVGDIEIPKTVGTKRSIDEVEKNTEDV